jgi:LysM repeat protein
MRKNQLVRVKTILVITAILVALVLPASAHAQGQVHVVQPGENLYRIALRYGTTIQALMSANGLTNSRLIYVGQRLRIPGSGGSSGGSSGSAGSTTGAGGVHVVQAGENLYRIALRYGTTIQALMSANGLSNSHLIYVGQRLRIPGGSSGGSTGGGSTSRGGGTTPGTGTYHVVQRGETVSSIALRYGTSIQAIATANSLRNPSLIYVGQRLLIPGGGGSSPSTGSSGGGSTSGGGGGGRWIDIDLSSQTLRAYQGNSAVRSMIVSTGISRYPTPPGRFSIYSKYPSVTMSGPGYYLPGVPHTMFFYRGYAIHGTYWHNNFGTPMSHGCVNLTRGDAAWLYSWAPVGTSVVIHW